jgi:hypothetical protein
MPIDLNSKTMLSDRINYLIDEAIAAARTKDVLRGYLGASIAGHACDRYVQYQWLAVLQEIPREGFPPRTLRIFDRGNIYEDRARRWLQGAGFLFALTPLGLPNHPDIKDFDGKFGGHVDGIIAGFYPGPGISISPIPMPALWECKCLGAKGWKALEKDGLKRYSSTYWGQVHTYMGYLGLRWCLFTAVNADTMELQHFLIEFDGKEFDMIKSKVGRVFTATSLGELLPRCTTDPAFYLCVYCPFRKPCWA